ncbi:MAG TPA: outer membrane protein assembly factor BamE, partial [Alphaproteobacteria bacterium]
MLTKPRPAVKHKSFLKNSFLTILATSLLLACAPTLNTRGNFLDDDQLKSIEKGISTKQDVAEKLGTPTTTDPFDQNIWMYIGETTETEAFFKPKVTSRRILKLQFDDTGLLSNIKEVNDKDGKAVELVQKTTPASG